MAPSVVLKIHIQGKAHRRPDRIFASKSPFTTADRNTKKRNMNKKWSIKVNNYVWLFQCSRKGPFCGKYFRISTIGLVSYITSE